MITYSSVINACAKGGEWQRALGLLDEMRSRGLVPDEITYNSVINACAKGDESQRALNLLDEMRSRGLVPNVITYNSVINACAKGGEWQRALNLLDEMRSHGLVPDEITYSSVIDACAKGKWQCALDLVRRNAAAQFDAGFGHSYDAALNACAIGRASRSALFHSLSRFSKRDSQLSCRTGAICSTP